MMDNPRFRALINGRLPFEVFMALSVATLLDEAGRLDEVLDAVAPSQIDWNEVVGGRPLHFYNGMTRRQVVATVPENPDAGEAVADAVGEALRARGLDFPENLGDRTAEDRRARGGSLADLMTAESPRVTAESRLAGDNAPGSVHPPVEPLRGAAGEPPPPGQADSAATEGPQSVLTAGDIRTIDPNATTGTESPAEPPETQPPAPGQGVVTLPATPSAPARPGLAPPGEEMRAAADQSGLRTAVPDDATTGEGGEGEDSDNPTFGGHPYSELEGLSDEELIALPNIGNATVRRIREFERGRGGR